MQHEKADFDGILLFVNPLRADGQVKFGDSATKSRKDGEGIFAIGIDQCRIRETDFAAVFAYVFQISGKLAELAYLRTCKIRITR